MPTDNEVQQHIAKLRDDLEMILVDGRKHWLVEGDHLLNAAELASFARAELAAREAPRPQMRVDRLVQELGPDNKPMRAGPWPLRWCLDTSFTADEAAQVRAAMLQATADWESICNVRFELDETANPAASDQLFVVRRLAGGGSLVAEAFFPWQGGDRRRVLVADGFFAADSRYDRVGVLRHELGHVLGFRHEHIREEAGAPPRLYEGWNRADPMGSYDPRSVMHYVFGSKGSYELAFTAYDRYHAWEAYPWPDRGPTANPYVGATAPLAPAAPAALSATDTDPASADAASAGLQVSIPLEHIVNLGAGGALSSEGWISSDAAHVRRVVDAFLASGRDSLTLYLHGGLNSERQGLLTAESLVKTLQVDFETYPLFFVWESGPLDSLLQRLDAISGTDLFGRLYRKIRKHLVKWRKARNEAPDLDTEVALDLIEQELPIGNPAALDPLLGEYDDPGDAGVRDLEAALAQDPMIQQRLDQIASANAESAGLLDPDAATGWLDASIVEGLREEHAAQRGEAAGLSAGTVFSILKFAAKILAKVVARFRDGSDHGFHATLVEELLRALYADKLGRAMWSQMKDNAAGAYGPDGGATLFLLELAARADLSRLQLNLVGQSAGAIHACHLVRHVAQTWPATFAAFHTVTFTVPACDPTLFLDAVVRNGHRIRRFRLFQMSDEAERADALVAAAPFLYPSSLLYLVSGVCEETTDAPILGMQRFLTDRPADEKMRQIRRFFAEINLRYRAIYVSPDPPDAAFTSHAGKRGPIADPLTLSTIAAEIRPGAR